MQSAQSAHLRKARRLAMFALGLLALQLPALQAAAQTQYDPATKALCGMLIEPDGSDVFVPCSAEAMRQQGPPAPPKPDVWGAIAVSAKSMKWGTSWNYKSRDQAASAALALCKSAAAKAGANDCRVNLTMPDVCAAIVFSLPDRLITIGGPIGAANFAADNARLICERKGGRSCTVGTAFCADGQKHNLYGKTVYSNGNPIFVPDGSSPPFGRR